jgi:hypothetical protein
VYLLNDLRPTSGRLQEGNVENANQGLRRFPTASVHKFAAAVDFDAAADRAMSDDGRTPNAGADDDLSLPKATVNKVIAGAPFQLRWLLPFVSIQWQLIYVFVNG